MAVLGSKLVIPSSQCIVFDTIIVIAIAISTAITIQPLYQYTEGESVVMVVALVIVAVAVVVVHDDDVLSMTSKRSKIGTGRNNSIAGGLCGEIHLRPCGNHRRLSFTIHHSRAYNYIASSDLKVFGHLRIH